MAVYKRGNIWWYSFTFAGRRIQESARTTRKTLAIEAEKRRRLELERAAAGLPADDPERRIKTVAAVVKAYSEAYRLNHRPKSVIFSEQRLKHVQRLLGGKLLTDLTEDTIRDYIKARLEEGASGRTINMELGELSRAIGKTWRELWPRVRKLEESHDVGKALTPEEERRLLEAARGPRRRLIGLFVRVALLTAMRPGEILELTWGQVDFERCVLTVGRAKTKAGTGRQIPMNAELLALLEEHATWYVERFGELNPAWYVFPYGKGWPEDPTRPTTTLKTAWTSLRREAGVECRLHDLRHTALTKMAEAGVPESTMLALAGHMSRAMLERYSHIRLTAKREAVEALTLRGRRHTDEAQPLQNPLQ